MLSENISEKNGFIRMICGIALVSFGTARIARNPDCLVGMAMIIGGAMKVAEGTYQYCPVVAMLDAQEETEGYTFN